MNSNKGMNADKEQTVLSKAKKPTSIEAKISTIINTEHFQEKTTGTVFWINPEEATEYCLIIQRHFINKQKK